MEKHQHLFLPRNPIYLNIYPDRRPEYCWKCQKWIIPNDIIILRRGKGRRG